MYCIFAIFLQIVATRNHKTGAIWLVQHFVYYLFPSNMQLQDAKKKKKKRKMLRKCILWCLFYIDIFLCMILQRVPALKESSGSSTASWSWSSSLDGSPSHWNDRRSGSGIGFFCLQLINEGLDRSELIGQLAKVGLQGIELLVQVIQSLRQRLDPGKTKGKRKKQKCNWYDH